MMRKLLSRRGETITEVLVSVLIVALSSAMLAMMISTAVGINTRMRAETDALYTELTAAETGADGTSAVVSIDGTEVNVRISGGEKLMAYEKG